VARAIRMKNREGSSARHLAVAPEPGEPATDNVVALADHFRTVFGREPDRDDLERLARCRSALAWRIAPPRQPTNTARVLVRWSQPPGLTRQPDLGGTA
jgi:hypothetical protein